MPKVLNYSSDDFNRDIIKLISLIDFSKYTGLYGVPRGGCPLVTALASRVKLPIVANPWKQKGRKILVVDDVCDSGRTRSKFRGFDFAVLHVKENASPKPTYWANQVESGNWIQYWWEGDQLGDIENTIIRQLEYIGEDPNREGLRDTPRRIVRAWGELFRGYSQDPSDVLTTFDGEGYDQIILLKDIEIYSMCEHHMLPFFGKAHVAYIPDKRIIGISKLARLVDIYARRLQIQERIGEQVTTALMEYLHPVGAACVIEATHLCMRMRGIEKQRSVMITSSMKGAFFEDSKTRSELMMLIKQ